MRQDQLAACRCILMREKAKLQTTARHLRQSLAEPESEKELSVYDNHPADSGDALFERGKDVALLDNAAATLAAVNSALRRIEAGTYGRCARCGRDIASDRLRAAPWAGLCLSCQEVTENEGATRRRPLEEEALSGQLGRALASYDETLVAVDGDALGDGDI